MFIETVSTPNPLTLKFIPGQEIVPVGTVECNTVDEAKSKSPLAESIFAVAGVVSVFLGKDFITVTKDNGAEWDDVKPAVQGVMMAHLTAGEPVIHDNITDDGHNDSADDTGENADIIKQIKELLDLRVRPAVARDGGDIVFDTFEDGIVYLSMRGACAGCPSSTATLKMGIENMLRHYIPEVEEVRAVDDETPIDEDDDEAHIQH